MQIESPSVSSTPDVANTGFTLMDVMSAKVLVKRLVQSGMRKGPSDLLVLPSHILEEWYSQEAVRYLKEKRGERPTLIIP